MSEEITIEKVLSEPKWFQLFVLACHEFVFTKEDVELIREIPVCGEALYQLLLPRCGMIEIIGMVEISLLNAFCQIVEMNCIDQDKKKEWEEFGERLWICWMGVSYEETEKAESETIEQTEQRLRKCEFHRYKLNIFRKLALEGKIVLCDEIKEELKKHDSKTA